MEVDLTNSDLFKNFNEFESNGFYIDLHNEFDCSGIDFLQSEEQFTLLFRANSFNKNGIRHVTVKFNNCFLQSFDLKFYDLTAENWTIDLMYRGRFERDDQLKEVSEGGLFFYYVTFCNGNSFELFAKSVRANIYVNDFS